MKKILLFVLFCAASAQAQGLNYDGRPQQEDNPAVDGAPVAPMGCQRNDSATVRTSADGDLGVAACTSTGAVLTSPSYSGSTSDDTKLEDVPHVSGDRGSFILGVRNNNVTSLTNTEGDYSPIGVNSAGFVGTMATYAEDGTHADGAFAEMTLGVNNSTLAAINLGNGRRGNFAIDARGGTLGASDYAEDSPHVTGDLGTPMFGIAQNNTPGPTSATVGDYVLPAISTVTGALQVSVIQGYQSSAGGGLLNLEDTASANADAGVPVLGVYRTTFSQSAGTAGDYSNYTLDGRGQVAVNATGADSSEWFRVCSGSITTAATTEVKALTASKYNYLTAVNCTNTHATVNVQILVVEKTGTPANLWTLNTAAIIGSDGQNFNPPLKSTAVGENLGVTTSGAGTVICCMEGFVSAL